MADKKIAFTAPATYKTLDATVDYAPGDVHTFRDDIAMRWISRGVATDDPEAIAKAEEVKAPLPLPPAETTSVPKDQPPLRPSVATDDQEAITKAEEVKAPLQPPRPLREGRTRS